MSIYEVSSCKICNWRFC